MLVYKTHMTVIGTYNLPTSHDTFTFEIAGGGVKNVLFILCEFPRSKSISNCLSFLDLVLF